MPFNGFALRTERSAAYNHEPGRGKESPPLSEGDREEHYLWCSPCQQKFPLRSNTTMVCPTCGWHLGSC